MSDKEEINYSTYLKLGTGYRGNVSGLLDCVHPLSDQPDEHLFITVHHGFEIWFKQILYDFGRVKKHLDGARLLKKFNDATKGKIIVLGNVLKIDFHNAGAVQKELGKIPTLLRRCRDLLRNLPENFNIIETMGQLAFINFRDYLTGGSGFQSHQFRMIENTFGLKEENRKNVDGSNCCMRNKPKEPDYKACFSGEQLKELDEALKDTIFDKIEAMLEDILDDYGQERFINEFKQAAKKMSYGKLLDYLENVFNERWYQTEHIEKAKLARVSYLSYKAFLGALIVHQFQSEPKYQTAYSIITLIVDLDEALMSWRARHVNMVHRMIGVKIGTGGTSGYEYLSSTFCDRYKVFLDLFVMSTYILPSKYFEQIN